MNDPKSQQEPSMEEILASIRRIISEDDKEAPEMGDEGASVAAEEEPAEKPEEDVFDLTEVVEEVAEVVDIASAQEPEPDELEIELQDEVVEEPAKEEIPEPEPVMEEPVAERVFEEPAPVEDRLVSDMTDNASTGVFGALAQSVNQEYAGRPIGQPGRTLEDLVKEVVRPMLKAWLDENLQGLVERLVRKEIERMSRRAEDG